MHVKKKDRKASVQHPRNTKHKQQRINEKQQNSNNEILHPTREIIWGWGEEGRYGLRCFEATSLKTNSCEEQQPLAQAPDLPGFPWIQFTATDSRPRSTADARDAVRRLPSFARRSHSYLHSTVSLRVFHAIIFVIKLKRLYSCLLLKILYCVG